MNPIALLTIVIGVPLALIGFFLTRSYCRASANRSSRSGRASYRADLFNSLSEDEQRNLRMASDSAAICAGIVASSVIHS